MDIVDIAVMCSTQKSIFANPPQWEQVTDVSMAVFPTCPSDHIALANAFNMYMLAREKHQKPDGLIFDLTAWCDAHSLNHQALEEARKLREAIGPFLKGTAKLNPTRASMQGQTPVLKALAIALCTQAAIFQGSHDEYRTVHENVAARLEPHSALVNGNYEWIVYSSLTKSARKIYLDIATAINAGWLVVSFGSCSPWDKN